MCDIGPLKAGLGVGVVEEQPLPLPQAVPDGGKETLVDGAAHVSPVGGLKGQRPVLQHLRRQAKVPLTDLRPALSPLHFLRSPVVGQANGLSRIYNF